MENMKIKLEERCRCLSIRCKLYLRMTRQVLAKERGYINQPTSLGNAESQERADVNLKSKPPKRTR
jgi:hypothetical protein